MCMRAFFIKVVAFLVVVLDNRNHIEIGFFCRLNMNREDCEHIRGRHQFSSIVGLVRLW